MTREECDQDNSRFSSRLRDVFSAPIALSSGTRLVEPGGRSDRLFQVVDGFLGATCRSENKDFLADIYVAGDLVDPFGAMVQQEQWGLETLGRTTVVTIQKDDIWQSIEINPALMTALWDETEVLADRYRKWFAKLTGTRSIERVAYLLCDLLHRLRHAKKVRQDTFSFPLTRAKYAQLCGISEVHLSRCVTELHETGTLQWRAKRVRILDEARLCRMGRWYPNR